MSREVRRVPLDWRHPVKHNPYWLQQALSPHGRERPASRLHGPDEMFVGLCDDYAGRLADWERERANIAARTGHDWTFRVEYHLTGYQGREDSEPVVHPFYGWSDDGESEHAIQVRDEDHLHELMTAEVQSERPDPADYMPDFGDAALGYCLYETVSEGTPTTPVFATPEELIEHLATVGQDYEQKPMRRAAAEALVSAGYSLASMAVVDGVLYKSDEDADRLREALS